MALKSASTATIDLPLGEGDFVTVREELSKSAYKALVKYFPDRTLTKDDNITPNEGIEFQTGLFETLVVGWSAADIPCTVAGYLGLDQADAARIDLVLAEHFQKMVPNPDEGKAATT